MALFDLNSEYLHDDSDERGWRSFEATGCGDTVEEFLEEISISETDQDGGELRCYGFNDADEECQAKIMKYIEHQLNLKIIGVL